MGAGDLLLDLEEVVSPTGHGQTGTGHERQPPRFTEPDFGTGRSSLPYLQRPPLRQLKIDRSFIRDVQINANSEATRVVIGLGPSLGLTVLAEGVETEGQREFMVHLGRGLLQGYHLGRPVLLESFEASLTGRAQ